MLFSPNFLTFLYTENVYNVYNTSYYDKSTINFFTLVGHYCRNFNKKYGQDMSYHTTYNLPANVLVV